MPAVRAAAGFAPTARSRKPMVLRDITHHTRAAAAIASRMPMSKLRLPPSRCGNWALPSITLLACGLPGCWMLCRLSRYFRPNRAT